MGAKKRRLRAGVFLDAYFFGGGGGGRTTITRRG
jgi:hypothetical protein